MSAVNGRRRAVETRCQKCRRAIITGPDADVAGMDAKADHAKYRHLPDVGRNIEVRRVRTRDATVRYKQVGLGLVLFVGHPIPKEFRQVEIWGWLPYDEAWEYGIQPQDDRSGVNRLVPRDSLRTDLP